MVSKKFLGGRNAVVAAQNKAISDENPERVVYISKSNVSGNLVIAHERFTPHKNMKRGKDEIDEKTGIQKKKRIIGRDSRPEKLKKADGPA
jgi:hypothetical protein